MLLVAALNPVTNARARLDTRVASLAEWTSQRNEPLCYKIPPRLCQYTSSIKCKTLVQDIPYSMTEVVACVSFRMWIYKVHNEKTQITITIVIYYATLSRLEPWHLTLRNLRLRLIRESLLLSYMVINSQGGKVLGHYGGLQLPDQCTVALDK